MSKWQDLDSLLKQCTEDWRNAYSKMRDEDLRRELFGEWKVSPEFTAVEWEAINAEVDSIWESEQYRERGYLRSRGAILQEVLDKCKRKKEA